MGSRDFLAGSTTAFIPAGQAGRPLQQQQQQWQRPAAIVLHAGLFGIQRPLDSRNTARWLEIGMP